MSRIEAMVSVWPVEDGFVTQVWRLVDGWGFSPSNKMQPIPYGAPGELGQLLLDSLELSERLSGEPYSASKADADYEATRAIRCQVPGAEIVVDREADGTMLAWAQQYDASVNEARQAYVVLEQRDPVSLERAIVSLLKGEGVPHGGPADLELLLRQLELLSRGQYTPQESADAFEAAADRFGTHPIAADLGRAAQRLRTLADGRQGAQVLGPLWDWLDGYDLGSPRPLAD